MWPGGVCVVGEGVGHVWGACLIGVWVVCGLCVRCVRGVSGL